jgi:hypothetical protein
MHVCSVSGQPPKKPECSKQAHSPECAELFPGLLRRHQSGLPEGCAASASKESVTQRGKGRARAAEQNFWAKKG